MPIEINTAELCVHSVSSAPLTITFPGGVALSSIIGVDTGDARATTQALLAYANTALAPLKPLLNTIDLVVAMKDVVTGSADKIPVVIEKAAAVAGIPLGVLPMIKGIVLLIVETVLALLGELEAIAAAQADIAAAMTEAEQPGNEVLLATLNCESENLEVDIANQNASIGPLNQIIGLVNAVIEPLTGASLPSFESIGDTSQEALDAIRATLELVRQVAVILPG
jgi:hypothetical protein